MTKRGVVRFVAIVFAVMMPLTSATLAFGTSGEAVAKSGFSTETKYASPDINALTGDGEEPGELSVSAVTTYQEKEWYEYVVYSNNPVASYRIDDDTRLLFFDPYTYINAMVMDVQNDASTTEYDTASEYSISHTVSKTITSCEESTYTNTVATQKVEGRDEYEETVTNSGNTKTTYNHDVTQTSTGDKSEKTINDWAQREVAFCLNETIEVGLKALSTKTSTDIGFEWYIDGTTKETKYSDDYSTTTTESGSETIDYSELSSTTTGWSTFADRVTKTVGSSSSTSTSWSESEGVTITKTYAATHFASDGVTPLPWAIVHYAVQMPVKCCYQIKINSEWITVAEVYSLFTTVKGTCRTWMQNGQPYYEDWGSGEPVVATDFWSQFTTKESLIKAYQDKLYPVGGEN